MVKSPFVLVTASRSSPWSKLSRVIFTPLTTPPLWSETTPATEARCAQAELHRAAQKTIDMLQTRSRVKGFARRASAHSEHWKPGQGGIAGVTTHWDYSTGGWKTNSLRQRKSTELTLFIGFRSPCDE